MNIHATAVVEDGARIADDAVIGPFAYVAGTADIGAGCRLGPHVVVLDHVSVGENCRIHTGAVLGDSPQDTAFDESCRSYVRIGANCLIREHVTIHRGTEPESVTEIGPNCFLMGLSHYAHNVCLGRGVIVVNGALLAGYATVGAGAFISGNCMVHQFVRIGRHAMLSGGSAVSKDVPPFCTTHGVSSNLVSGLNVVGMRRAGLTLEARRRVKEVFRILYQSDLNVSQATAKLKDTVEAGPARDLVDFVASSKRGICRFEGGLSATRDRVGGMGDG